MKPPHASGLKITSRIVTRYYFNGKGYSTKQQAYRAKAKRLLLELVLGPWEEDDCYGFWRLANAPYGMGPGEAKKDMDRRFGLFFPHGTTDGCVQPGCIDNTEIRDGNYHTSCYCYGEEGAYEFKYESCKWSQEQWIKAKVKELMQHDAMSKDSS